MTLLGKVLVFVNLAFSLAVAFFITQSYAKRTDWNRAYKDADKALQAASGQRDQYQKEAQECQTKAMAIQNTLNNTIKERDGEKAQLTASINDLRAQVDKQKATIERYGLTGDSVQSEVARLSKQAESLQQMLASANKQRDDDAKKVEDFRQRAVKAEIDNKSLAARNNELLNVIEEKEKELIKQKTAPGSSGSAAAAVAANNPPPGDVQGRVKSYDPTSGLLTITIGSDAGILKNHTLQVYRLDPRGQYVGTLRILEVRPTEAVGKMVGRPLTPVQVNDKVGSKIS